MGIYIYFPVRGENIYGDRKGFYTTKRLSELLNCMKIHFGYKCSLPLSINNIHDSHWKIFNYNLRDNIPALLPTPKIIFLKNDSFKLHENTFLVWSSLLMTHTVSFKNISDLLFIKLTMQ